MNQMRKQLLVVCNVKSCREWPSILNISQSPYRPYNQLPPYFSSLPSFTNRGLLEAFPSITLISPLIFFASPTCSLFPVQITWSCSVSSTNPWDPGYGKVVFRSVERGSSNPVSRVGLGNAAINVGYIIQTGGYPSYFFRKEACLWSSGVWKPMTARGRRIFRRAMDAGFKVPCWKRRSDVNGGILFVERLGVTPYHGPTG